MRGKIFSLGIAGLLVFLNIAVGVYAASPTVQLLHTPGTNYTTTGYILEVVAVDMGGIRWVSILENNMLLAKWGDCAGQKSCTRSTTYAGYPNGTYNYHAEAENMAGQTGSSDTETLGYDQEPPVVGVTGAPGSWTNQTSTADVLCTDIGMGCDPTTYVLYVNTTGNPGSCPDNYSNYTTTPPYNITSHSWVCAAAMDYLGNTGFSDSPVEFLVDQVVPTITVNGAPGSWVNSDQTASVGCSDSGDSDCDSSTFMLYVNTTGNPGSCPVDYSNYTSSDPQTVSDHVWVCAAGMDNAGNFNVSDSVEEFLVDEQDPNTTHVFPNDGVWNDTDQTIILIPGDQGDSGLDWTRYCTGSSCDPQSGTDYSTPVMISAEGVTYFVYSSEDNAGNRMSDVTLTVMIDKSAPTTADDASTGWTNQSFTVTLTCSDSPLPDNSGCDETWYVTDGSDPVTSVTRQNYTGPFALTSTGQYQLRYYSFDNVGNTEGVVDGTLVQIDLTNPVVSMTSPQNMVYTSSSVDLNYTVVEPDSGIDTCWYVLDGNQTEIPGCNNITLSGLPDGAHNVTVYANDTVSNVGSDQTDFVTDTNLPSVTIDSPQNVTYDANTVDLNFTVVEANLDSCWYIFNGGANQSLPGCSNAQLSGLPEGQNNVSVYANDTLGGIGSDQVLFFVDTAAPGVIVQGAPGSWVNTNQTASVSCNDGTGGGCNVSSYKLYVNSTNPGVCPSSESEYTVADATNMTSNVWVCGFAMDNAGNSNNSQVPIEFLVDQIIPNTTDDFANHDVWANSNQTITLTPNDLGGSGISWTRYCTGSGCDPSTGTDYTGAVNITSEGITYFR